MNIIIVILIVTVLSGCTDVTAQIEQEAADRKADVKPEDRIALMSPMPWDATMKTGIHEHLMPFEKERIYQRRTK